MRRIIAMLLLTGTLAFAGEHRTQKLLAMAAVMFAAGNAADLGTSVGMRELNPVLGRGAFGAHQAIISAGAGAGIGVACRYLTRHKQVHAAELILFGGAAAHGVIAWHNATLHR